MRWESSARGEVGRTPGMSSVVVVVIDGETMGSETMGMGSRGAENETREEVRLALIYANAVKHEE